MGATLAIGVTGQNKDLGDFTTGLYVWEGSSSDPLTSALRVETVRARDVLGGIPVLWWKLGTRKDSLCADRLLEVTTRVQATTLGAVEFDQASELPFTQSPVSAATFRVCEGTIELISHTRELGFFEGNRFPIHPRLSWFLVLCETVSVVIESPISTHVATFTKQGEPPTMVFHNGTIKMKSFDAVVEHSGKWSPSGLGNISLLAGMADTPDHHVRSYMATPTERDIPDEVSYEGECIACGAPGNSREHCVPSWVARGHRVVPVVAPLFCAACNHFFGTDLEAPIAAHVRSNTLADALETELFSRWSVKTALTLSAASDVIFERSWMVELRAGHMPEGFQIFAKTDVSMEPGYLFTVTHFSRSARDEGLFLFSFAMNGLLFVVVHNSPKLIELPGINCIRPPRLATPITGMIDPVKLHDYLVAVMTGHQIHRSAP